MSAPRRRRVFLTTLLLFELPASEWRRGLAQMRTAPPRLRAVPGLRFAKMLGCGVAFGLRPNLRRYGLLAEWETADAAQTFLKADPLLAEFAARGWHWQTHWLQPIQAHGLWDQQPVFRPAATTHPLLPDEPVAVLTRASIRWQRLWAFWRAVPAASRAVQGAPGLRLSLGMGELPLIRQATFSIWHSLAQMQGFAYQDAAHREIIQRTRSENWYAEELFVRFRVLEPPA